MKAIRADRRLAGLDGLRAVAVIAVVLFHADFSFARGGYLGVDLFFVISGFLITGLLIGEIERTGRLGLGNFYLRRAKRLLPASWAMTLLVVIAAAVFARDALPRLRYDSLASILYATNWELINAGKSYFEFIGREPLLLHLWSLAIEEQFYILWAPIIFFLVPRFGSRVLAVMAIVLALASAAWMAVLNARMGPHGDPTRLYFGTDTHGFALLIGAALGVLWRPERLPPRLAALGHWATGFGGLAGAAMLVAFACLSEATEWLYPNGFLLSSALSVALIAGATHPGGRLGGWLDRQPMRWIGERSYGIYLWHWPIFVLTRPGLDLSWSPLPTFVLRVALTLLLSALSYRFLEMPVRGGAIERLFAGLRSKERARRRTAAWRSSLAALASGGFITLAVTMLVSAPADTLPAPDVVQAITSGATSDPTSVAVSAQPRIAPMIWPSSPSVPDGAARGLDPFGAGFDHRLAQVFERNLSLGDASPVAAPSADGLGVDDSQTDADAPAGDVTAVGDSVLLGSSGMLVRAIRGTRVYAHVGWQAADVLDQVRKLHDAKVLTPVFFIHLGTNGYVMEDQLRQILTLLSGCKLVILANTHVPRRWMDPNNELIDRVLPDFRNAVLANWKAVSNAQPDFFVSDGVHLTIPGQRAFIGEIIRAGNLSARLAAGKDSAVKGMLAQPYPYVAGDLSKTLVPYPHPVAPDQFWYAMAHCETGTNWKNGGRFSGGLGIYTGSWTAWGGLEFAPTPAQATPEQQIVVANRISTQGWVKPGGATQRPVGFSGWGCLKVVGRPTLIAFTPESVLAQQFHWFERGQVVRELQAMLGLPRDGIYGKHTSGQHLALLEKRKLPLSLAAPAQ